MSRTWYDHIIAGMGCAGLSLAVQLSRAGLTKGKKILLIDREAKTRNDRTWCFWETAPGPFESLVFRQWDQAWFHAEGFSKLLELRPYRYKMIRGIDFFEQGMDEVRRDPAFEIVQEPVLSVGTDGGSAYCRTKADTYRAPFLFNSILFGKPQLARGEYYLLQHFKGWVIRADKPVFSVDEPVLMDFRPSQDRGTSFVYLMPFSAHEALVEYTLFTAELLRDEEYDEGLRDYIRNQLGLERWEVVDEEFGVIPMTNHQFRRRSGAVLNIGTAGGRTKASSGYTFRFIQKDTMDIIRSLRDTGGPFRLYGEQRRFHWYDSVLLNILQGNRLRGDEVFRDLFRNNKPGRILKFLDNETAIREELSILASLPQVPFMMAGIEEGLKWMKR